MPFVPVPNTAMVEILMTQDNQQVENTLYFNKSTPWTVEGLTTMAGIVMDWWLDNLQDLVSNTVTLRAVKATSLESATAPAVEVAPAVLQTGTLTSEPLPNHATLAIKFNTAGRGRSSRGRNYIVGLTEGQNVGNEIADTVAEAFRVAYAAFLSTDPDILPGDIVWVVVSRFTGGEERTTGLAQPVTSVTLTDLIIDSQRRRLPGRGR